MLTHYLSIIGLVSAHLRIIIVARVVQLPDRHPSSVKNTILPIPNKNTAQVYEAGSAMRSWTSEICSFPNAMLFVRAIGPKSLGLGLIRGQNNSL